MLQASYKWYRNTIFPDALELEQNGGPDAYITMMQDLDKIPVGSDTLLHSLILLVKRTPINDPLARNSIWINAAHA